MPVMPASSAVLFSYPLLADVTLATIYSIGRQTIICSFKYVTCIGLPGPIQACAGCIGPRVGDSNVFVQWLQRSVSDFFAQGDNASLMEGPYQKNSVIADSPSHISSLSMVSMAFCCIYIRLRIIPTPKTLISA